MKVILLHNAAAGGGNQPSADQLLGQIREAGHAVVYQSTREKGSKWILLEAADLVIAAGGDGTVRKAALGAAGRGLPLAIFPLGTANNLAKTFGVFAPIPTILQGLATARRARLDVGMASGPWGKSPFIESAGAGLLARLFSSLSPRRGTGAAAPSVTSARHALQTLLRNGPALPWSATVDGRTFEGAYVFVEAMNTRSVGPNLQLAPGADPGDGLLDFVFLPEENRTAFARYLEAENDSHLAAPVEVVRGKTLRLRFDGPAHVDDLVWPPEDAPAAEFETLDIQLSAQPIELLVPVT